MIDFRKLEPEVTAVRATIAGTEANWPAQLSFQLYQNDERAFVYDCYPYLFRHAFPGLTLDRIRPLAIAGRLFATAVFIADGVMDGQTTGDDAVLDLLRLQALQFEAYQTLYQLFPPESPFWPQMRGYLAAYVEACLLERSFAQGERSWSEFTEEVGCRIIIGKCGVAKCVVAGLATLAGQATLLPSLTASIDHYYIAFQMWDDLQDWKEDLATGQPSLLLARLLAATPDCQGLANSNDQLVMQLTRKLYYHNHAQAILQIGLHSLHEARATLQGLPELDWMAILKQLEHAYQQVLTDIDAIVTKNVKRASAQPKIHISFVSTNHPRQQVAQAGLQYLCRQWQLGFGEACHMMNFAHEFGFTGIQEHQSGDIFQRAVIADLFCDVSEYGIAQLQPLLDREIDYLLNAYNGADSGWSYFPQLPELPPDADTLAQILQVLVRTQRHGAIANYCETPLQIILDNNCHPTGAFETWILPPSECQTPRQQRQAEFVWNEWGRGADNEVIANLLYALQLYDSERFGEVIARGVNYLTAQQAIDGSWTNTWYSGPYYGIYVILRLLAVASPHASAIGAALQFLRSQQLPDGGWGNEGVSDPLSTALALLGLAIAGEYWTEADDRQRAAAAFAYLDKTSVVVEQGEVTWPDAPFIRMDIGRATATIRYTLTYGSKIMTTAFVVKALLAGEKRWCKHDNS